MRLAEREAVCEAADREVVDKPAMRCPRAQRGPRGLCVADNAIAASSAPVRHSLTR